MCVPPKLSSAVCLTDCESETPNQVPMLISADFHRSVTYAVGVAGVGTSDVACRLRLGKKIYSPQIPAGSDELCWLQSLSEGWAGYLFFF